MREKYLFYEKGKMRIEMVYINDSFFQKHGPADKI